MHTLLRGRQPLLGGPKLTNEEGVSLEHLLVCSNSVFMQSFEQVHLLCTILLPSGSPPTMHASLRAFDAHLRLHAGRLLLLAHA